MHVVALGVRCNNACVFCAQAELRATDRDEPSVEELRARVREARSDAVAFVGGEPTVYDVLPGLVELARTSGAKEVLVQSNGRRLGYAAYAAELARSGVTGLDVSLHGSTAPMHDYHTSTPGSFAQTLRGAVQAASCGMRVVMNCTVTRSNYRHLAEIVRVASSAGCAALRLRAPLPVGSARLSWARLACHAELVRPYLRAASAEARRSGVHLVAPGIAVASAQGFIDHVGGEGARPEPEDR